MKTPLWSSLLVISLLAACQHPVERTDSDMSSGTHLSVSESNPKLSEGSTLFADSSGSAFAYRYTEEDLNDQWDVSATEIELHDTTAVAKGTGVTITDNKVTITQSGTYVFSGSFRGQIHVAAATSDMVHVVFNNASVVNDTGAALFVEQASKAIVTVAANSNNQLSEVAHGDVATVPAVVVSHVDLVMNGRGRLHVSGKNQGGIISDGMLIFVSGGYDVVAATHALEGKNAVIVRMADITVTAGEDGIIASNNSELDKGYVLIENGSFRLNTVGNGINSETATEIYGGSFDIKTAGDTGADVSAKGITSAKSVIIASGEVTVQAADDGIHSNGDVTLLGGQISIDSGDDGVHADNRVTVSGTGTLNILKSVEGVEGGEIFFLGGNTTIVSSDDGVNAAGGKDTQGDSQAYAVGNLWIHDGTIWVESEADGIDANGNIEMTGGLVWLNGPEVGENGVIDFDGTFTLTGGDLWAAGIAKYIQAPTSSTTTQITLAAVVPEQAAETELIVTDGQGAEVTRFIPTVSYAYVVLSSPLFRQGETYTLSTANGPLTTVTATQIVNWGTDSQP